MTTPSSPLNALIIVAGEEAAAYAETLTRVPDLNLVACCDRNGGAARALGERYEVDHYQSIEAALANKPIDIALVCTPPLAHADNVRALLQGSDQLAGILCATPPALSGADVERMCSEADRKGVALTFGFHLRHSPAVRWVRRLLDTRRLGDIKRISVESLRRSRTPSSGTRTMAGGGPGLHLLPPALDLALHLAEGLSPSEVTATTSRRVLEAGGLLGARVPDDSDVEESIAGTLLLRDDDDCPVQLAFASDGEAHIPRDRLTVELHCTKGSATLELVQERNRGARWSASGSSRACSSSSRGRRRARPDRRAGLRHGRGLPRARADRSRRDGARAQGHPDRARPARDRPRDPARHAGRPGRVPVRRGGRRPGRRERRELISQGARSSGGAYAPPLHH